MLNNNVVISVFPYLENEPTLGFLVCNFPVLAESYRARGLCNIGATINFISCMKSLQAMRKSKNKNGYSKHDGMIATKKEQKHTTIYYNLTTRYCNLLQYYCNILAKEGSTLSSRGFSPDLSRDPSSAPMADGRICPSGRSTVTSQK